MAGTYRHKGSRSATFRHAQVGDLVGDLRAFSDTRTSCLVSEGAVVSRISLPWTSQPAPDNWARRSNEGELFVYRFGQANEGPLLLSRRHFQ